MYPIKIHRDTVARIVDAHNAALAAPKPVEAQEPVAYTSRVQLDELKKNPGHIMSMWSKGLLPPHEEIPLYASPSPVGNEKGEA
jgi:hypothetical protein